MLKNIKQIQSEVKKTQANFAKMTQQKKNDLLKEISKIQSTLQTHRQKLIENLKDKRIIIDQNLKKIHKKLKVNLFKYIFNANIRHFLSTPFIYSMIVPLCFFDLCLEIYHNICFPLYGIPKVKRRNYFIIDRHKLGYLNLLQKLNCLYCEYGNALMAYGKEIVGRTEEYWCPIKHSREIPDPHNYYNNFYDYSDGEGFVNRTKKK